MKLLKIEYSVYESFAVQNKSNIKAIMNDLRELGVRGLKYTSYLMKDNKTFIHISQVDSEEAELLLHALPSFKYFTKERDLNLERPVLIEELALVGSSFDIFPVRDENLAF